MPSTRPLRLWLELRIALAAMAPLALIAVLILTVLLPQLRADLEIRHQALAHAIAGQIEAHLLGPRRELCVIAEYIHGRGYRPAPFWFDLLDAHAGTGDVFAALPRGADGASLRTVGLPQTRRASRRDSCWAADLSHRAFLREAQEHNEVAWSETFLSAVTGRLAVSLAIPAASTCWSARSPSTSWPKFPQSLARRSGDGDDDPRPPGARSSPIPKPP
ncbi:MAG: hypothetical protein U1F70_10895 [Candidatus Competibacteraceae bacterium]